MSDYFELAVRALTYAKAVEKKFRAKESVEKMKEEGEEFAREAFLALQEKIKMASISSVSEEIEEVNGNGEKKLFSLQMFPRGTSNPECEVNGVEVCNFARRSGTSMPDSGYFYIHHGEATVMISEGQARDLTPYFENNSFVRFPLPELRLFQEGEVKNHSEGNPDLRFGRIKTGRMLFFFHLYMARKKIEIARNILLDVYGEVKY
jgi:hypothetical protein